MSNLRPNVSRSQVLSFLSSSLDGAIDELKEIKVESLSQVYSFEFKGQQYVLHISSSFIPLQKNLYAYQKFSHSQIPIPKVLKIGSYNNYYYSISEKVEGRILDAIDDYSMKMIMPELFQTLEKIHSIDISSSSGFGNWDNRGNGYYKSWKDYLLSGKTHEYFDWHGVVADRTFFDIRMYDKVWKGIEKLAFFTPDIRTLVHGDYRYNNILVDKKRVTGVLDWEESLYGDPVLDIAMIGFWFREDYTFDFFKHYYTNNEIISDHFRERLLCYQLLIGICYLYGFAKTDDKVWYDAIKDKLENLFSLI